MWPFRKRQKRLPIPEYEAEHRYEPKPVVVHTPAPKDDGIEVQELEVGDEDIRDLQTRTGMQRVFDRVTGKFK